jgi:hypothetical protein
VNAPAEQLEGGAVLLNLSVIYRFSWARMESTLRYFFGDQSIELGADEPPGTKLELRPDLDLSTDQAFQHFRVLSTFLHEQFHLRHLTGSPFGLVMYMLGARQYLNARSYLQAWGERIGREGVEPRIPVTTHHADDPEISDCLDMWYTFQEFQAALQGDVEDLKLLETTSQLLLPALEQIQEMCSQVLGRDDGYPDLDVGDMWDRPFTLGKVTSQAVVEGLARANEFLNAIQLGLPLQLLNRQILLKYHGEYVVTASMVEQQLG